MGMYDLNERWWLLEDALPDSIDKCGNILSLTPTASYRLSKLGIKYSIIEDFYDEQDLLKNKESYFFEQLKWFNEFDELLKSKIEFCRSEGINLAMAHYYRIKCLVDSLAIFTYKFTKFIEKTKPKSILYVSAEKGNSPKNSIYEPFDEQKNIIPQIIKGLCEKEGIPVSVETVSSFTKEKKDHSIKSHPKEFLKKFGFKQIYYFSKYSKISKYLNAQDGDKLRVLILHAGCLSMDLLIKDLISKGDAVFLKTGNSVNRIDTIFHRHALNLDTPDKYENEFTLKVKKDCEEALKYFFKKDRLTRWISDKCGFDVSKITKAYFKDFIENICFKNLLDYNALKNFYNREKLDFVVARAASEGDVVSSLLAAAGSKKRVCFQHSCGAFSSRSDDIVELKPFDYYFTMHDEAEEETKEALRTEKELLGNCKVLQAPYQIKAIKERMGKNKRDNDLIMYVPTKLFFGFRNYNMYLYPFTWYFEFQKAIIDLLSQKHGLRFIFKSALGQDWCEDSILLYIKDKKSSNISIYNGPLINSLKRAGRVILDFPSTGFYEAAAAGTSVISLHHELFKMRDSAKNIFGKSLASFKDIDDAVRIIDNFLNSDSRQYIVDLPVSNNDAVGLLRNMVNSDAENR